MVVVGYVCVLFVGQLFDVQVDKLLNCDKIFQEKVFGVDGNWFVFKVVLEYLCEGDVFVFIRIDCLVWLVIYLLVIVLELIEKGVVVKIVDQGIDMGILKGCVMINMLVMFVQFEMEIWKE